MNPLPRSFAAAALALSLLAPAYAAEPTHWVGSWTASPQATWGAGFVLPNNAPDRLHDQTVRQVARISVGGARVRIALSNAYGREPVVIGAARIARSLGGSRIDAGSDRALTFGGRGEVTLLPGAPVLSDPVELNAPALAELAVSLYLPQDTALRSFHWEGGQDAYLARGDRSAQAALEHADTVSSRPYLSGIYVESERPLRTVVAFGDSITDGAASTPNRNHRWPDFLARRLAPRDIAVLNAGISGAQVLNDGMGVNALARFERDVLAQRPDSVVLLMGINDIGWPGSSFEPAREAMSAQRLIGGYRQLIARAPGRRSHHRRHPDPVRARVAGRAGEALLQSAKGTGAPASQRLDPRQRRIRRRRRFRRPAPRPRASGAHAGRFRFRRPPASGRCRLSRHGRFARRGGPVRRALNE